MSAGLASPCEFGRHQRDVLGDAGAERPVAGARRIADEDALIGQPRRAVRTVRDHHARHGVSVPAQLGLHMELGDGWRRPARRWQTTSPAWSRSHRARWRCRRDSCRTPARRRRRPAVSSEGTPSRESGREGCAGAPRRSGRPWAPPVRAAPRARMTTRGFRQMTTGVTPGRGIERVDREMHRPRTRRGRAAAAVRGESPDDIGTSASVPRSASCRRRPAGSRRRRRRPPGRPARRTSLATRSGTSRDCRTRFVPRRSMPARQTVGAGRLRQPSTVIRIG